MENFHLSHLISSQAKKYGERAALYHREEQTDEWTKISWNSFAKEVSSISKSFVEIGVSEQQRVAQFSQNKAENLIIDFALFANRAVMVPLYATSSAQQVEYIVNDAEIGVIFVGDQQQYNIAYEVAQQSKYLKKIIAFDKKVVFADAANAMYYSDFLLIGEKSTKHFEVDHRHSETSESDLACILYTSGTTGNPKGVMMPHSCFTEAMRIHNIRLTSITDKDTSIAFLPLSHVFERTWCYFCIFKGVTIYINLRPTEIQQTIKDVHPTLMCAVPRFWEKVYAGVKENLSKYSPIMLGVIAWAVATGKRHNVDILRKGKQPDVFLKFGYSIADKLIFSKVKETLGIENANMLPTAGAKLSDEIALFFRSIGVPIVYGYGLTESTATVCCYEYVGYEIGTVGNIMPDVSVKIGDDNEILLKGKTIFPGYYNNPEANAASFTEDGWFKTGDAGYIKDNKIVLTERIKDLFKTSNGKYIAPQEIETRLALDKYIEQVAVIGDERNYVTAIIAPNIPALEEYAQKHSITYENIDDLLKSPKIHEFLQARIIELQKGMANYEIIKRFTLIRKSFAIETGELTNTLKIRRAVVMQKYKSLIDEMYAN
ncbi:AMP-dependent synthetase and ligase [Paludibacter propionicigenes WB4]|uniref:AMP-dependent synthetase and ligase n=1 Tax=Paludibacter propionicigenes (strain DSM 17365 / JCM 13257 / WB4) TaxID=694427 RepID=E4T6E5_PALPW|nr:long-chain fatty acid--CoA ligase [Paludibacter propionicigenes]ADQ80289.1 AMP-dependent synthetase and ligase [Paludibacter propionicigenes WB4]